LTTPLQRHVFGEFPSLGKDWSHITLAFPSRAIEVSHPFPPLFTECFSNILGKQLSAKCFSNTLGNQCFRPYFPIVPFPTLLPAIFQPHVPTYSHILDTEFATHFALFFLPLQSVSNMGCGHFLRDEHEEHSYGATWRCRYCINHSNDVQDLHLQGVRAKTPMHEYLTWPCIVGVSLSATSLGNTRVAPGRD
jgi:hypothetical protein